jgi:hypothetical protein
MNQNLQALFAKLDKAHFTGKLTLRLEDGKVVAAKLKHYLEAAQFANAELPCTDQGGDFSLKP